MPTGWPWGLSWTFKLTASRGDDGLALLARESCFSAVLLDFLAIHRGDEYLTSQCCREWMIMEGAEMSHG